jgi:hypothetical protein
VSKAIKLVIALGLIVVLLAGVGLVGCGGDEKLGPLKAPTMSVYQYLKGVFSDFNKATIQSMAGAGEGGFLTGMASSLHPSAYTTAARDAVAKVRFPNYWYIPTAADVGKDTKFSWLQGGDPGTVDTIILTSMPQADQDVVSGLIVAGFFNGLDVELADALPPNETSAYGILLGASSKANADAWAAAIGAVGADYSQLFFYHMLKETIDTYGCAPVGLPVGCTTAQIAGVGKAMFTNGTAGTMYPTKQEAKAQALYSQAYSTLDAAKQAAVDGAVYGELNSCFANAAARTAVRDYITAVLFGTMGFTTYASLPSAGLMQNGVDQYISGIIDKPDIQAMMPGLTPFGPHLEREYIDFFSVPGAIGGWGKEMADALELKDTTAAKHVLEPISYTSVKYFLDEVAGGMHMRQAFYQALAWTGVYGTKAMGTLVQLAMGEFSLKIDNKWEGTIAIDNMSINIQVKSTGYGMYPERMVDVGKLAIGDKTFVPPEGVILKLQAPLKTMDILVWLVMAGLDSTAAGTYAADCWGQISPWDGSAGTATFVVTVEATISSTGVDDPETITETYDLTWTPS